MNRLWILAIAVVIFGADLRAKNIDLVTLPAREGVQLTIYNSEDITLVKEQRFITLKKGINKLQFSWANTLIDPTSVEFRPLEHVNEIEVADTTFPGQKPQHLIWNINSQYEGQVKVEVMYFTSGISWHMDYVAVTNPQDTEMKLEGFVRVTNNSGEEYEDAQVRLIVGKVNLVEKIAELARRRGVPPPPQQTIEYEDMEKESMMDMVSKAEAMPARAKRSESVMPSAPKAVVKEGLSEYFIFTVDGQESVPNGWSKRMRAIKADDVKFDIVYRMRAYQYGPRPVRFLIWNNDEKHNLGDCPLPDGRIRVFRDNGRDGLSFLGEKDLNYVPIKADIEVNIGEDDFVVYKSLKMSTKRYNFHFYNVPEYVDGWDEEQTWAEEVRNYRDKPIVFELRRVWDGDVDYSSEVKTTLFDYRTTEVTFSVPARGKNAIPCKVVTHNGANAKQSRVELKQDK